MTILLLIRHGLNDFIGKRLVGRLPGVHLNEAGRQQAQALADTLQVLPICAVYSSPLERAQETAFPLAQALGLLIQVEEGLAEIDFGAWQGKTPKQLHRLKLWQTAHQTPSRMRFPGGESFAEAQVRAVAAVERVRAAHADHSLIACFSHCDSLRLVIAAQMGMPLDAFHRLTVDPASVSALMLGTSEPRLLFLNQQTGSEDWLKLIKDLVTLKE